MRKDVNLLVIETVEPVGTEWGVSFTDSNPEARDYFKMTDRETAFRLKGYLSSDGMNDGEPISNNRDTEIHSD